MPYKENEMCSAPSDPQATIWRYMDLAKFLSLIDKSSLFFIRVDKLVNQDPYEGLFTHLNVQIGNTEFPLFEQVKHDVIYHIEKEKKRMIEEENKSLEEAEDWGKQKFLQDKKKLDLIAHSHREIPKWLKTFREKTFVNSWHIQEHQSAAMWNLYARNSDGIAIESTYNKLIFSIEDYDEFDVNIGTVKYIDYQKSAIPVSDSLSPFLHKRKSFEHEKELRALINTTQYGKNSTDPKINQYRDVHGLYVNMNLDELINRIFISPTAEHWITDLLKSVIKRHGINKEIIQSDLFSSAPIY